MIFSRASLYPIQTKRGTGERDANVEPVYLSSRHPRPSFVKRGLPESHAKLNEPRALRGPEISSPAIAGPLCPRFTFFTNVGFNVGRVVMCSRAEPPWFQTLDMT